VFQSGSDSSVPSSANLLLNGTSPSTGSTATAMLTDHYKWCYYEAGVHTATIATQHAPISWNQGGVAKTDAYSIDIGTKVNVGSASPTLKSASVPVLITAGEAFQFSALAESGLQGGAVLPLGLRQGRHVRQLAAEPPFSPTRTRGLIPDCSASLGGGGGSMDFPGRACHAVNVLTSQTPVPLPAAVWGGLGLVSALGAIRVLDPRRKAAVTFV
jgi:hypothetical protein